jgi:hypothetical protein
MLSLTFGCKEDEIFKTVPPPDAAITFTALDEAGNTAVRGSNSFEVPNPLLTDQNATTEDIKWTAIVDVGIPAGTSIERIVVEYQFDLIFASGGSGPQGWMEWDELEADAPELDGNRITYPFNADEVNQIYWGGWELAGSGMFNIVKDLNNVRFHVFLDNGLDQMSAKIIHWYPVVSGDAE